MTRRRWIVTLLVAPLCADEQQDIRDLFTQVAAALSAGDPAGFMRPFNPSMPGYHTIELNVAALARQAEIRSTIEVLRDEGDDSLRKVELDWYLNIVELQDAAGSTQRREVIRCQVAREKKKWRIVSLQPLAFFAPPGPPSK